MDDTKSTRFEMRAPNTWLAKVDDWRAQQRPVPPRAEAIRRLVHQGLRYSLAEGDAVMTSAGPATVTRVMLHIGSVEVLTRDGSGHVFPLIDIDVAG